MDYNAPNHRLVVESDTKQGGNRRREQYQPTNKIKRNETVMDSQLQEQRQKVSKSSFSVTRAFSTYE
jgi:hypothetical protein